MTIFLGIQRVKRNIVAKQNDLFFKKNLWCMRNLIIGHKLSWLASL